MLYERTAWSRQPDALIEQELAMMRDAQHISPSLIMRDPYILDFLGLRNTWQESDLESAIIREWNRSCWSLVSDSHSSRVRNASN